MVVISLDKLETQRTGLQNESMVSLVLRQYMRGENGTESLVLIRIGKQNVKIIVKRVEM